MSSITTPSQDIASFSEVMARRLNEEMCKASEPLVAKAVTDIENALRRRVAEMVAAWVQSDYVMYRDGMDIVIKVKFPAAPVKP